MINRNDWVDEFQKNISELIARSPAADIERNIRAFMTQTFSRLDLVTREEFDVQVELLQKALQRITALESRLDQLEGRRPAASQAATGTDAAASAAAAAAERNAAAQKAGEADRAAAAEAAATSPRSPGSGNGPGTA